MLKSNKTIIKTWTKSRIKQIIICTVLLFLTTSAFAQSDIIPAEINTTFESIKDWVKGEFAPIMLGLLWICSCIGYAFNKDSNRAKMAFIAVSIACLGVGLGAVIVDKFVGIGK